MSSGIVYSTASSPPGESAAGVYARNSLVGVVLPVLFAIVNGHLVPHWISNDWLSTTKAAAMVLAEICAYGILAARFLQPRWFAWLCYAWMLAVVDLSIFPLLPDAGWWRNSSAMLVHALWSAQLDLVVLWAVFGPMPWPIRAPVATAALTLGVCLPVVAIADGPGHLNFILAAQTVTLLLVCLWWRWRGYRMNGNRQPSEGTWIKTSAQFRVRDLLLWTTTVGLLLGFGRAFDLLSIETFSGLVVRVPGVWLLIETAAILTALNLAATLNVVLGGGTLLRRWMSLMGAIVLGTLVLAGLYVLGIQLVLFSRPFMPIWSFQYWDNFGFTTWPLFFWAALASALLAAVLVFPRALGYRLCKERREPEI
jgi:hypothetical protein